MRAGTFRQQLSTRTWDPINTYADAAFLKRVAEVRSVQLPQGVVHVIPGPEVNDTATFVVLKKFGGDECGPRDTSYSAQTHHPQNFLSIYGVKIFISLQ